MINVIIIKPIKPIRPIQSTKAMFSSTAYMPHRVQPRLTTCVQTQEPITRKPLAEIPHSLRVKKQVVNPVVATVQNSSDSRVENAHVNVFLLNGLVFQLFDD